MLDKVRALAPRFRGLVSVDGGITRDTGARAREAGARVLVAGTSIFRSADRTQAIGSLRGAGAP